MAHADDRRDRQTTIPTFDTNDLSHVENLIGNGGMGIVSLYKWRRSMGGIKKDDLVAVKRLGTASDMKALKDEAKILWGLHEECEYILRLYGVLNDGVDFCLLLEYMKYGNIATFFRATLQLESPYKDNMWPLKIRIASQVCKGMEFLHGYQPRPILHRDLKAANVLLDGALEVKICDFGLAKIKEMTTKPSSTPTNGQGCSTNVGNPAGTVSHLAPELLRVGVKASKKSDVYSFGILLWELITDKSPYEGAAASVVINEVSEHDKRPDMELIPEDSECSRLVGIMTTSWKQYPTERPQFSDLTRDFQGILRPTRDVKHSVMLAIKLWETRQVTHAKLLNDPINGNNPITRDENSFKTPNSAPDENSTQVRRRTCNLHSVSFNPPLPPPPHPQQSANVPEDCPNIISDVLVGDLCISADENSTDNASAHTIDEGPGAPLLRSAHRMNGSVINRHKNTSKGCIILKVASAIIALTLAGSIGYLAFHFSDTKGCCLHCFNWSDPSLQSDCSPMLNGNQTAPPGSKCTFSCGEGFVLNGGQSSLTCDADGKWSGALPYCRKVRQCTVLPQPANGGILQCTNKNFESSVCTFGCPNGYRIRFPGGGYKPSAEETISVIYHVTCEADVYLNYHWSGPEPYCEKAIPCSPPPVSAGVQFACNNTETPGDINRKSPLTLYHNGDKLQVTDNPQNFTNGTTCQFSCQDSKQSISEDRYGACQETGKWNFTSTKCIAGCPSFEVPDKGSVSCTLKRNYDSRCTFACQNEFVMLGSNNMVCLKNGKWTSRPPSCACPACRSGSNCTNSVNFKDTLISMNESTTFNYDGHLLSCYSPRKTQRQSGSGGEVSEEDFKCQCRDTKTNNNKQCNKCPTQFEACRRALASLILIMASNGTYTLPCDADLMPSSC